MTSTVTTPAQVVNLALAKVGSKVRVANLFDGSEAAKKSLDIYGAIRDQIIYEGDWDFAQRSINGVLLKQAPTIPPNYIVNPWTPAYPAVPWAYEYAFPADAVKIRGVKPQPVFIPNFDPRYFRFWVDNDNGLSPPQKVILCNVPNAIIFYSGQITNPITWNEAFLELLTDSLGKALGPVLLGVDAYKIAATDEAQDMNAADAAKQRS